MYVCMYVSAANDSSQSGISCSAYTTHIHRTIAISCQRLQPIRDLLLSLYNTHTQNHSYQPPTTPANQGSPAELTQVPTQTDPVSARIITGTRKFDSGLAQLLHADLHWLDVSERVLFATRSTTTCSDCPPMPSAQGVTVPVELLRSSL